MTTATPPSPHHARRALAISALSLTWTLIASAAACVLGIVDNSLVLVAFGAVGLLDAAGSTALVLRFRHSLRHESDSESHERIALKVITIGLFILGAATAAESFHRLVAGEQSTPVVAGVVLAAVSALVLAALAVVKRLIAAQVGSHALDADGWVSAIGSALALVTLVGTGLAAAFSWTSADPVAATVVAAGAVVFSIKLRRDAARPDVTDSP